MQLVERHVINRNDTRFPLIDAAAFAAKNLYNAANYIVRQSFITGDKPSRTRPTGHQAIRIRHSRSDQADEDCPGADCATQWLLCGGGCLCT